jgi:hypothetical protein
MDVLAMNPEEFGAMNANIKGLCDRVTVQSMQISELTKELRSISDQMLAGKSGIQGFKMGVSTALLVLAGSAGAGISAILDRIFHG